MANYIIFSSESSNGIILAKSETEVKTDIETKVEPDKKTKVIVSAIKRNPHGFCLGFYIGSQRSSIGFPGEL